MPLNAGRERWPARSDPRLVPPNHQLGPALDAQQRLASAAGHGHAQEEGVGGRGSEVGEKDSERLARPT